jgi:hypothetical protein
MAAVVRLLLCVAVLGLSACKTGGPQEPPAVSAAAPHGPEPVGVPSRSPAVEPAPPPSILDETLQPVRGGQRVLPVYRGPDPCKMALLGESPVAKACSEGGERQAIELMQSFVKRARAEGIVFQCIDCHIDEDDRTKLAPQADAEFRKLLFLARPPE